MSKCDFPGCEEKIEYLPFKCRYCGKTYCNLHRLPENHNCALNSQPIHTSSQTYIPNQQQNYQESYFESQPRNSNTTYNESRQRKRIRNRSTSFIAHSTKINGTYWLIGLNIVFFIISQFSNMYIRITINQNTFSQKYYFHTLLTSIFLPNGIISLIFSILILYWSGKMIELVYGAKFLFTLYFICGLCTGFLILILQLLPIPDNQLYYSSQDGSIMGLMVFICYTVGLEREMTFLCFFIPIKLKAKHIILFMGLMRLVFGLFGDISSLASIIAIPVAAKIYKNVSARVVNFQRGPF